MEKEVPRFKAWIKDEGLVVDVQQIDYYDKTVSYIEDDPENEEQIWVTLEFHEVIIIPVNQHRKGESV